MQSLINRQKAEHEKWKDHLHNLNEDMEAKHELCKSAVEKASTNYDTKIRQLKTEILQHITAELENIKPKFVAPQSELASPCSTTTNSEMRDKDIETGLNQSEGNWEEPKITSRPNTMKDKASTLIKSRPLIIHGSIGG